MRLPTPPAVDRGHRQLDPDENVHRRPRQCHAAVIMITEPSESGNRFLFVLKRKPFGPSHARSQLEAGLQLRRHGLAASAGRLALFGHQR
jgi:hypothetical protein